MPSKQGMLIGCKLHHLTEVDSTNEYAKSLIKTEPEGTVVLADMQTAGRGRGHRLWYSPIGGIWLSVILRFERYSLVPIIACVAISEAFNNHQILLGIKWPNDLVLDKKKVAGVLCEVVDTTVILGIGINLNIATFPDYLEDLATSILIGTGRRLDKEIILRSLFRELDTYYLLLKRNSFRDILTKWRQYTIMFGRNVRIELPDKIISGRAIDIDADGALVIMLPDGKIEKVIAGDCTIVNSME